MRSVKILSLMIAIIFIISSIPYIRPMDVYAAEETGAQANQAVQQSFSYEEYLGKYQDIVPTADVLVPGASYSAEADSGVVEKQSYEGRKDVLDWTSETGWVEWDVEIPQTGCYNISMEYFPLQAKGRDIELGLEIDGSYPFESAKKLVLSRAWKDDSAIQRDNRGNDLRPRQAEVPMWLQEDFKDVDGLYDESYKFYLTKGPHKLRIHIIREALSIAGIHIYRRPEAPAYSEVSGKYPDVKDISTSGVNVKVQAESPTLKSHATLYPTYDRSGPATEPSDPSKVRLNTIGQLNWKFPGEWITWKFSVPEDGYYRIAFRARQNLVRGMYSSRRLYIDGSIPFKEMENVKFPYKTGWYVKVLGDKDPYLFYLKKGEHELKMEVTLGDIAETCREVEKAVLELNGIYRKIVMITGSNADEDRQTIDTNRDFLLDQKIPGMMDSLRKISSALSAQVKRIEDITGTSGSEGASLEETVRVLESFIKEPETIPSRLDGYKSNVSSLGSWILYMREQPLEFDYFTVQSPDQKLPAAGSSIFAKIAFDFKAFINSFAGNYNSVGNVYDSKKALNVWISANDLAVSGSASGRDQASVVKSIIDDLFVPQTGIPVNLSLVDSSSTLIQATLGGKGPDVALLIPKETPVNLAMRGALVDLSKFSDFNDVTGRFFKSAMIPYEYEGGYYALPETQEFSMFFYRKDIFDELGIKAPDTWNDFYDILPVIQKSNMQIGIPESQLIFQSLLFQNGGKFYADNRKSTGFDQPEALEAFKAWTGFYLDYSFPLIFDFYNRFRTGEMPAGIMPYTMYNLLSVAAPELRNLWGMAPIPGTLQKDGSVNRAESANGTGCIIIKSAKDVDAAYEFVKWWTSAEVQARYGIELESLMGPAGRYNTANVEAFKKLPWSKTESDSLLKQWESVWDIPQLPGNYYTTRNLTFAFRKIVYDYYNERETLYKYNKEINKEIVRKREEFGLK